jgi:hypothetical protein
VREAALALHVPLAKVRQGGPAGLPPFIRSSPSEGFFFLPSPGDFLTREAQTRPLQTARTRSRERPSRPHQGGGVVKLASAVADSLYLRSKC